MAITAVKGILRGMTGPKQHWRGVEAKNGKHGGFKVGLEELDFRRDVPMSLLYGFDKGCV